MIKRLRPSRVFIIAALLVAALVQGCSTLEPLPRFRTSSTSFAPDQLPLAKRSAIDLIDPTALGAYSALKEEATRQLAFGGTGITPAIVNRSTSASAMAKDEVGLDIEQLKAELASEDIEEESEEPAYDEAAVRRVVDRAYLNNAVDETVEENPGVNRVNLMSEIVNLIGVRYHFGGNDAVNGIDCSAFTGTIYSRALGVRLPRSSVQQFSMGDKVKKDDLKIGDLVFFKTRRRRGPVSHVGIYIGANMFAHASSRYGVIVSTLGDGYYKKKFVGARRILDAAFTDVPLKLK